MIICLGLSMFYLSSRSKYTPPPAPIPTPLPCALQPVKRLSCSCLSCLALACRQLSFPQWDFTTLSFPREFFTLSFSTPTPKYFGLLMAIQAYQPAFCSNFFSFCFIFFLLLLLLFVFVVFYAFSVIFFLLSFFTFSCAQIQLAKINIAHTPRCLNNINY